MSKAKKNSKSQRKTAQIESEGKNVQLKHKIGAVATKPPLTLSSLRQNSHLWYRILLLLHDFHHQKQEGSKSRTDQIVDVIYIGTPYFTPEEAERIKSTIVDEKSGKTLEETVYANLEHRQATTLTAIFPCGPHDMVPVYLECFGIGREEIEERKFLSRVAQFGLEGGG